MWPLLDLLLKDKSTGVSSQAAQTWQEITSVVAIFRQFGGKEQVGMVGGYGGYGHRWLKLGRRSPMWWPSSDSLGARSRWVAMVGVVGGYDGYGGWLGGIEYGGWVVWWVGVGGYGGYGGYGKREEGGGGGRGPERGRWGRRGGRVGRETKREGVREGMPNNSLSLSRPCPIRCTCTVACVTVSSTSVESSSSLWTPPAVAVPVSRRTDAPRDHHWLMEEGEPGRPSHQLSCYEAPHIDAQRLGFMPFACPAAGRQ